MNLFYLDGAVRLPAQSNTLNENEIKRYSLPSLMGNDVFGTTVADFMAILQSINYRKFERFSKVADEISTKLLSSFLECEILVVVSDQYSFEFSIKAAERKHETDDSTHMLEFEIIDNEKFPKSFQSYLGNSDNKTTLVKFLF